MIYRCILAKWVAAENPDLPRVQEGEFTDDELSALNAQGYNIYYLPNYPSGKPKGASVAGSDIDTFRYVFVDMDLKEGKYATKEDFIQAVGESGIDPTVIIDTGNGIHIYWEVTDLDAMSYLRLSRRLMRLLRTDEAVGQIFQLMRVPGTYNTKLKDEPKLCEIVYESTTAFTCETLDKLLPPISMEDEQYCKDHYDKTYNIQRKNVRINDDIPLRFNKLLKSSKEVKEIWSGNVDDRSKGDWRLGHIMHANGFTKEEAVSVLVNSAKAIARAPTHRLSYAENIVDKVWGFEEMTEDEGESMCESVLSVLAANPGDKIKGTRLYGEPWLDNTDKGFRLGQVIGLVAGAKVGKTAMALNMFRGFVRLNPDYYHCFVTLEQPANEIAGRWKDLCGDNIALHDKVVVISNYNKDGSYRNLSLSDIREQILAFQQKTGRKIGCTVIDHIGVLRMEGKNGENQRIADICHQMKSFAIETNTLLVMQSQAPREKAGIGDIELNKDAAYGTVFFEAYCDYLITIWQPLKRCYDNEACPTVMAFKFCAIRHKKRHLDVIQEDVNYRMYFNPETEILRPMTQTEDKSFDFFIKQAVNKRKQAMTKTEIGTYKSTRWDEGKEDGEASNHKDAS